MQDRTSRRGKSIIDEAICNSLEKCISEMREKYPLSLKVSHLAEITNLSKNSIYLLLESKKIPYSRKIKGWRVARDPFLHWWLYCEKIDTCEEVSI